MLTCDRQSLIALTQGVLLDRGADGRCRVGDKAECYDAIAALDRGETVALTSGGRIVSTICELDGVFEEVGCG